MIMVTAGVGAEQALLTLRARAFRDSESTDHVARAVIKRVIIFGSQ
ncbi:hypothetical protein [Streptomyces sp. NPDC001568]